MDKKICLITGTSSGIGESLARLLIKDGWFVIGIARRTEKLEKLKEELGSNFLPITCDVGKSENIRNSSDFLKKQNIIPKLFFLNAGCGEIEDEFHTNIHRKTFETNYFGIINWIEEWLSHSHSSTFVAISSLVAVHATPHASAYCASKAAIRSCFESLKIQHANSATKFITVMPGPVKTDMLKANKPLPFTWEPQKAAAHVLKNVFKGKKIISFPIFWWLFFHFLRVLPTKMVARILL
ncbi:Fatty acyl-CoA reductase [Wolbachia endosymbiont of Cylisticus convexus]|uniref:SDR family NAD(P)-dependent oxidoreductase n=1 Tax=Wolbachia endosymbiont of Cylisticus convexus TaxID=118728 RepID=UPI000DF7162D|nr:SDR family NAD(P)-dependent oxidoreductase [Wolbachia endosymbiont of Cylisticus convexus]RDD34293.1 Fatty acyl-CoA reductase [Wolbachia endosymbiont of Cylisticus convexus]